MSKRKGLSVEEKRQRMQELFIETKDVFTLKQLETTCSKQKGIVSQTVKDILDGLCSDNMVSSDKIGTSNYFWLFPSQSIVVRKNQIEDLKKQLESSKKRKIELTANIEKASKGREVTDDRKEKLKTLAELEAKNAELQQELTLYADNDPERVEQMIARAKVAMEAGNRWTDNIWCTKSWCQKTGWDSSDWYRRFEISEDFDYLE